METRKMIVTLIACFAFFVAWQLIYNKFVPPPKAPPAQTPIVEPAPNGGAGPVAPGTQPAATRPALAERYAFTAGQSEEAVVLGKPGEPLTVQFSSRGGAISTIELTEQKKNGKYVHRKTAAGNEPFSIVHPIKGPDSTLLSYPTRGLRIEELGGLTYGLDNLVWQVESSEPRRVTFSTTLNSPDNAGVVKLVKSYRLDDARPIITLELQLENLTQNSLTAILTQDGPAGIAEEISRQNMRRVFAASRLSDGAFHIENIQRDALVRAGGGKSLMPSEERTRFEWTALTDKYFAVFTHPVSAEAQSPPPIAAVSAIVGAPWLDHDASDAVARLVTTPLKLPAGGSVRLAFEIIASPKDPGLLAAINPAYVDSNGLNLAAVKQADRSCCTFEPLPRVMTWLLETVHQLVRNYGLAIIVLVIIVRTILHPLAVFQQKSMYRMQESMGRVQPKLQAAKEKYANDKVKQQQEIMRVYAEENVNPMAPLVGMLPLFLQMPILVALWTALNDNINLRHAPFDGWWIKDLSSPDAFITFPGDGLTVPVLSWFPLIGWMFKNIPSLNVLPILMGVSMYLQQKYMPKPAIAAKLEAAKDQPPQKSATGLTPEEQLRQQKMIANMMSIMFPVMFYYMPSGLNLYWMATNIYGIFESLLIRKQLAREKETRDLAGPLPPKKPGLMSKIFKTLAEQAETLQNKADDLSLEQKGKKRGNEGKDKRK